MDERIYQQMQQSLFFRASFPSYLILILLLGGSFLIYSYDLESQKSHWDELLYLAWGGVYFDSMKELDLNNPCLKNIDECDLLFSKKDSGHQTNYTPIRNFLVGFGQYLTTGENKGDFYEWSCMFYPCWEPENWPSPEEFSSGRFFSPIFGSLTIGLAFLIGKILFNRTTGLFFSLILLFYSLWLVNSRLMMSEVYLHFFILLSIFLLLKSFNKQSNHRILYFIFGAISFGFALNVKFFALELVIPILVMILFYNSFNEKLNFSFFKNKKNVLKAISLILVFFVISSMSFVATYPKYYDNTLNQILKIKEVSENVGFASLPTAEKNYLFHTLLTLEIALVPYLMDYYIHDVFSDEAEKAELLNKRTPLNHSTIPLSIFFFIGLIYIIRKIEIRNLNFSEFALLIWFTSLFILAVLLNDVHWERYYLPLMFPVMMIASYALGNFVKQIKNQKEKILFFTSFIIAHSLYIISFFEKSYLSNTYMKGPFTLSSQQALNDPLVYVSSIIFIIISFIVYIRTKKKFLPKRDKETFSTG